MHECSCNGVLFYRLYSLSTAVLTNQKTLDITHMKQVNIIEIIQYIQTNLLLLGLFLCTNIHVAVLCTNKALLA